VCGEQWFHAGIFLHPSGEKDEFFLSVRNENKKGGNASRCLDWQGIMMDCFSWNACSTMLRMHLFLVDAKFFLD
jgi:hypothetical protein